MGIATNKSSAVSPPRYMTSGDGMAAALPRYPRVARMSVSNQALPAPGKSSPGWPRLSAIAGAAKTSLSAMLLCGRGNGKGRKEEPLQRVLADVLAAHEAHVRQACAVHAWRTGPGQEAHAQDVYPPEQIRASRDLHQYALDTALSRCWLKGETLTYWQQAGDVPGARTLRTAGFVLMDPALPAPMQAKLVAALQAYARAGDGQAGSAIKELEALQKTIAKAARQAHWGEGGYEGLQRVLLDRMMPALLEGIQQGFGANLWTAVSNPFCYFNAEVLQRWESQVIDSAYDDSADPYHRVEQFVVQYTRLPDLMVSDEARHSDGHSWQ